jgi:hypothetical protein
MAADSDLEYMVNHGVLPEGGVSNYARKTMKFLKRNKLQPFFAQCKTFIRSLRMATATDLICVNHGTSSRIRKSNLVNVQLKTGFDKNYERVMGFFSSPSIPQSILLRTHRTLRSMHQLQLLVEHMMLKSQFGVLISGSLIMRISETEHRTYPLKHAYIQKMYLDVYQNLKMRHTVAPWQAAAASVHAQEAYKETKKGKGAKK